MKTLLTLAIAASALVALPALADPVTSILSAQYFKVLANTDGDFPGGTPVIANGSALGPDGLPIVSGGSAVDVNAAQELTWWSPNFNAHVIATGTGTVSLPYSSNMYAPNSTGGDDGAMFETALFSGSFALAGTQDVTFSLGSDDDSFIYVDNTLIGQNPGIHGVTNVSFTASQLGAGTHSLEVFYADRQQTGAYLSLSLQSAGVTIVPTAVPEPGSIALLGSAIAGLALVRSRRATRS